MLYRVHEYIIDIYVSAKNVNSPYLLTLPRRYALSEVFQVSDFDRSINLFIIFLVQLCPPYKRLHYCF
jgi:hypothetical protein